MDGSTVRPPSGDRRATFADTKITEFRDLAQRPARVPRFHPRPNHLHFLITGGNHPAGAPGQTTVNLVVNGQVVRTATGDNTGVFEPIDWDIGNLQGQSARVQVVDQAPVRPRSNRAHSSSPLLPLLVTEQVIEIRVARHEVGKPRVRDGVIPLPPQHVTRLSASPPFRSVPGWR